jgi:hypothetical protein
MVGKLLLRGMVAGLVAGLLAFGFARFFGEPFVDRAIAIEELASAGQPAEPEIVSRPTQAGIGLLTALTVYGAAIGGLFALVFAFVQGRIAGLSPRATAALLALAGFLALVLVPALKYPSNPPAVGDPDTIAYRTELFGAALMLSIAALAFAVLAARRLAQRFGPWNGAIVAAAGYVAVLAVAYAALPGIDEVPEAFPAALLWGFRLSALGVQAVLWTVLGLVFGFLVESANGDRKAARFVPAR